MKKIPFVLAILLLLSIQSCEPVVSFTEPQPKDVRNLNKFPNRLQGDYFSETDSSTLRITDNMILHVYSVQENMATEELLGKKEEPKDTIIEINASDRKLEVPLEENISYNVQHIDTLLLLCDTMLLRKYKGAYFLNKKLSEKAWEVTKIELSKGTLLFSKITEKMDIENLKEITESPLDTIPPYSIDASKKQFKEYIKKNGFSDTERYIKL